MTPPASLIELEKISIAAANGLKESQIAELKKSDDHIVGCIQSEYFNELKLKTLLNDQVNNLSSSDDDRENEGEVEEEESEEGNHQTSLQSPK